MRRVAGGSAGARGGLSHGVDLLSVRVEIPEPSRQIPGVFGWFGVRFGEGPDAELLPHRDGDRRVNDSPMPVFEGETVESLIEQGISNIMRADSRRCA